MKKEKQTNQPQDNPTQPVDAQQDNSTQPVAEASKKKAHSTRTPEQEKERALRKVNRRKKFKYGTFATVLTVIVLAIVVFANVICGALNDRFHWNIDLTSSGLYEITEQTKTYLGQINADIEMVVMAEESVFEQNSSLKIVQETLERFQAASNGHISLKYVDMTANPEAVKQYSSKYSGELQQGDVVVACKDLVRVISFDDLIHTEQSMDYTTYQQVSKYTFIGEQSLLSAIMGVTDLNPVHVAIIDQINAQAIYFQYDSYGFGQVQELLEKNNYQCTKVDIANGEVDPTAYEMAVLCAPYNDLTEAQIDKLTNYLYNNGQYGRNLLYFASPYQLETPNLDAFLETWGITVGSSLILEGDTSAAQYVRTAIGQFQSIPLAEVQDGECTKGLVESKLPIVAPLCRPLNLLFESNSGRTTEALLMTPKTAFLYPLTRAEEGEEAPEFDQSTAETGSFALAALATNTFSNNSESFTSNLLVFGSEWLLDPNVASSSSYNNANFFVTAVNALSGKETKVTIAEKSLDTTAITITDAQRKSISTVVIVLIPLMVAVVGIVVFIRRKNR